LWGSHFSRPAALSAESVSLGAPAAIQFRESVGFRADQGYVEWAAVDRQAFPDLSTGYALTRAEAAEIRRRQAVQESLGPAREFAHSQADYGGTYIDQLLGGVPVFLFAGDPESRRDELSALLPAGTEFRVERVRHTYAELDAVQAVIDAETSGLQASGIPIVLTGLDPRTNTVLIGLTQLTPEFETLLRTRYGDIVSFRRQGP